MPQASHSRRKAWTPRGAQLSRAALLAAVTLIAGACGDQPEPDSPLATWEPGPSLPPLGPFSADAHPDVVESLLEDLVTPRHASDGGGTAWLEEVFARTPTGDFVAVGRSADGLPIVEAESRGRFHLVYQAGPLGIAEGGSVFLQISPFWEWDDPQPIWPDGPGYTEVSTSADGVVLEPLAVAPQLLAIEVQERALAPGEQIHIVYGAGEAGAHVDRFAESKSRIWIAVDGDGDGVRRLIETNPSVLVRAQPPAFLIATVTSTAEPGDEVRVTLSLLDAEGNADPHIDGSSWEGEIAIDAAGVAGLPERVRFRAADHGRKTLVGRAQTEGIHRLRFLAETERGPLSAESNPLVVRPNVRHVLWADLHGHSHLSDGTGTPDDFYAYAREVAALDVAALTDHDHWGLRFLDAHPEIWSQIRTAAEEHYEPGRFVTLLGYEWTSWLHGHRHVLYFSDQGEVYSSLDPRYETPAALWDALRGQSALTFAHHSAGGPVSTNWRYAPDPVLEPLTEIVSVHGSSEAPDSPLPIYDPVPGNYVRDALNAGYTLGFLGSGDTHDGHPGIREPGASSGLAGIFTRALTREAVLEALRARQVYATNGPRIYLRVELDGQPMGSITEFHPDEAGESRLRVEVLAPEPIVAVDLIRSGIRVRIPVDSELLWTLDRRIPALQPGEYHYVRVVTEGEGAAWSSPIFAR